MEINDPKGGDLRFNSRPRSSESLNKIEENNYSNERKNAHKKSTDEESLLDKRNNDVNDENGDSNMDRDILQADSSDDQNSSQEEESNTEFNNKRIILQRFTIYNSLTTMYIVGSNAKESLFRILEITKDPNNEGELTIIEDKNYFYTRKDMVELINGLNESIEGGIHKLTRGYGLLGFIKFTKGYYLSLVTKCSQVAILGGHYIYHVDDTKLIPLDIKYKKPDKYSDEEKLLSIFKYLELGKTFYFSYTYDITNTLQINFIRNKILATKVQFPDYPPDEYSRINNYFNTFEHNERFVWNKLLLKPVLDNPDTATYEWFQPIIHGFVDQANISIYGRKIYITIIARRSHHFAGARFLKRGVNDKGNVANEVETEQIVSDMLVSSFHDTKYGFYNNPRFTSFVQHRGSIPLYWTQDLNRLPKPPIEINLSDPFYQSSAMHFNNLFERYGSPIIILNLIKTKERQPRELKLNQHFINCITYLNQFLPQEHKLQFISFDMSKQSKKNADVIQPLQTIAEKSIKKLGYFHNGTDLATTKVQTGIIRTNCIDCLDRTNAAQFIICKEALSYQLAGLGLIPDGTPLEYDSDIINILTEIFHDHGDTIAIQYGGSNLVNTMDSYRRINQWSSHTRDMLNSIKRIYSNSFMDLIRQEAINLFLGNYIYDAYRPKLWELQNDYYLHNENLIKNLRVKRSYIQWFNKNNLSPGRFKMPSIANNERFWGQYIKLEPYPEFNDNWFNECYIPRKFQSFSDVFQYCMNSNSRYLPSHLSEESSKSYDYNPFKSRKHLPNLENSNAVHENYIVPFYDKIGQKNENTKTVTSELTQYTNKEGFNDSKEVSKLNIGKKYITNHNRIKTFLANKIEMLGYSTKPYKKGQYQNINQQNGFQPNLNITNSFHSNIYESNYLYPQNASQDDVELYKKQLSLADLIYSATENKNHTDLKVKDEDEEIYKKFTNIDLNQLENSIINLDSSSLSPEAKANTSLLNYDFYFPTKDNYFNESIYT